MNDSLIYPCLVHLMKIINSKQGNTQKKQFHHAHLLINHFIEGRQMFNQKPQVFKTFLHYYQQRWILSEDDPDQLVESESCMFLREIRDGDQKDRMVVQIIARILLLGIQASLGIESTKEQTKQVIRLCQQLHMNLVFEGASISNILLQFIEKITLQIKNLMFYQTLLKIFVKLDFYQIINSLETSIAKFRQDWNKTQQEIQMNVIKKSRESVFLPSGKRNLSLEEKQKGKENNQIKQNVQSVRKPQKQIMQSNFKLIRTAPKVPQSSRRRTLYKKDNGYTFNNRGSTADFFSSIESNFFEENKMQQKGNYQMLRSQNLNPMIYHCSQSQVRIMENEADDVLADSTPKKKKTNKRL